MSDEREYVPSTQDWVRDQVDTYERSGGTEANTLRDTGIPIIVVTMSGRRAGNIRKIALMRVEHDGEYALVASMGGAPTNPVWYHNLMAAPDDVQMQDGPAPFAVTVREVRATSGPPGGNVPSPCSPTTPSTRERTRGHPGAGGIATLTRSVAEPPLQAPGSGRLT